MIPIRERSYTPPVEDRNSRLVREYFLLLRGPHTWDDETKELLETLQEEVRREISGKGIELLGPGDKRIGDIFSSIKSSPRFRTRRVIK